LASRSSRPSAPTASYWKPHAGSIGICH